MTDPTLAELIDLLRAAREELIFSPANTAREADIKSVLDRIQRVLPPIEESYRPPTRKEAYEHGIEIGEQADD